jgi:hypothetical protein
MWESIRVHGALLADAVFVGWQRTPTGKAFAIYNIIVENHPSYHSTVTGSTLRKLGLKIPPFARRAIIGFCNHQSVKEKAPVRQ